MIKLLTPQKPCFLAGTIRLVISLLLVSLLAACATQNEVYNKPQSRAQLVLASTKNLNIVAMDNVRFGNVGSFVRAEVDVRNRTRKNLSLQYKVEWRTEAGFSVSDMSSWHQLNLAPDEVRSLQSVAKVPEAWGFQLVVKEMVSEFE
ncbi:MAG: YcfL family protein [Pseudomonadales bacterium]|nr:YcfL family protein [Pseudomonadales bacterium]